LGKRSMSLSRWYHSIKNYLAQVWGWYIPEIPEDEYQGVAIFVSLSIAGLFIWVLLYNQPIPLPDRVDINHIKHTKEYQITLRQSDWKDRDMTLNNWISTFNSLFPLMKVNRQDAFERIFLQRGLHVKGHNRCRMHGKAHMRVREYISGPYSGATLDVKESGYPHEVCGLPYWPSDRFYNTSSQKCEEDIHPCFTKNSRVTKIFFNEPPDIKYCADLHEIFPEAFLTMTEHDLQTNKPRIKGATYIWVWEFQANVHGRKVIFSFDIKYPNLQIANSGIYPPSNGEFSIRIYPDLDGAYPVWNETWVQEIDTFYFNLVLAFDKFSEHITCAKSYFKTGKHAGSVLPV